MDYSIQKFTGSIDSVNNRSFLSYSLKRIAQFKDATGSLYNSVVISKSKMDVEIAKNESFEVFRLTVDNFTYTIVKGKKYTLECGTSRSGPVPNFYEIKTSTQPNLGFRPPCLGIVALPPELSIFAQPEGRDDVPGDGCSGVDCKQIGFLDASNGYIANGRLSENPKILQVGGQGYSVNRKWTWNGQDIKYLETRDNQTLGESSWKFVSSSKVSKPWDKFQDFLPNGVTTVAVESEAGKRYSMQASKIDEMEQEVQRLVKENARLSDIKMVPKPQPLSPFIIVFGVFIVIFVIFAVLAIFKKR